MKWADLTLQEQCVLVNAIDEGDLRSLLVTWGADLRGEPAKQITELGVAVLAAFDKGLVETFRSDDPQGAPAMRRNELARTVRNPRAWWNGEEGLEEVIWIVLTDLGHLLLSSASVDEMYAFERRDIR